MCLTDCSFFRNNEGVISSTKYPFLSVRVGEISDTPVVPSTTHSEQVTRQKPVLRHDDEVRKKSTARLDHTYLTVRHSDQPTVHKHSSTVCFVATTSANQFPQITSQEAIFKNKEHEEFVLSKHFKLQWNTQNNITGIKPTSVFSGILSNFNNCEVIRKK